MCDIYNSLSCDSNNIQAPPGATIRNSSLFYRFVFSALSGARIIDRNPFSFPSRSGYTLNPTATYFEKWGDFSQVSTQGSTKASIITQVINGIPVTLYLFALSYNMYKNDATGKTLAFRIYQSLDNKYTFLRYTLDLYENVRCYYVNAYADSGNSLKFIDLPTPTDFLNYKNWRIDERFSNNRARLLDPRLRYSCTSNLANLDYKFWNY